jgi:two-component system chemotaxis response regulator CheY
MRDMVRAVLEADHHAVVEAPDGRQALAAAETQTADLVITHVNLPVMDGLALVRALRERERYRFTPILALTTENGDDIKQRRRAAGAATLAQGEASCVVFGMPRAAIVLGAAERVLPLDRLGEAALTLARTAAERRR